MIEAHLYIQSTCEACKGAAEAAHKAGYTPVMHNIDNDPFGQFAVLMVTGGHFVLPLMWVNGEGPRVLTQDGEWIRVAFRTLQPGSSSGN